MRIALATENNAVDGRILLALLRMLGVVGEPWETAPVPFSGRPGLIKGLPTFLRLAQRDGVDRALVSLDNDGGARRRPPHQEDHEEAREVEDYNDACTTCLVRSVLSSDWKPETGRSVIAVPIQILETWLLCAVEPDFSLAPEQEYARPVLKKRFWGEVKSKGDDARLAFVFQTLANPDALGRLRQRPSFVAFASQVTRWRSGA